MTKSQRVHFRYLEAVDFRGCIQQFMHFLSLEPRIISSKPRGETATSTAQDSPEARGIDVVKLPLLPKEARCCNKYSTFGVLRSLRNFKFLSLTSNFCISHNSENMRNLYTASRSHRLYAYPSWKTTLAEECLSTMERNACRGISAVEFSHAVLRSALTFICSTPAIIRSSFKSVFYSLLRNPFRRNMK